jgi:hypothetical protein
MMYQHYLFQISILYLNSVHWEKYTVLAIFGIGLEVAEFILLILAEFLCVNL